MTLDQLRSALTTPEDFVRFDELQTGVCDHCSGGDAVARLQNTAYVEPIRNWASLCERCQQDNDEYWAERWAEYRAAVL